jgi:DNA-binding winged helix-turn-helix (wHTH) protein
VKYWFSDIEVDVLNLRVAVGGHVRPLEPKSFRLLVFLIDNRSRVVPKDEIIATVWSDVHVTDNALTRAIGQIRTSLCCQRVKPAKREGKRLNRTRRGMTPKAQPARIDGWRKYVSEET